MRLRNFHRHVRALLLPRRLAAAAPAEQRAPLPARFSTIEAQLKTAFERHDEAANIGAADRYRSAVWVVYGLTAMATLSAVLNVAAPHHDLPVGTGVDVLVILVVIAIYLVANQRNWHEHLRPLTYHERFAQDWATRNRNRRAPNCSHFRHALWVRRCVWPPLLSEIVGGHAARRHDHLSSRRRMS